MSSRHVITYLIPPGVDAIIRDNYLRVTGKPITIDHLHVSVVPSFYLRPAATLDTITGVVKAHVLPLPAVTLGLPNTFFTLNKHIVYLPVIPPEPLQTLHRTLLPQLENFIDFDLSLYDGHHLPPYLPHTSLDYDYPGDPSLVPTLPLFPASTPFTLDQPVLFTETEPHRWQMIRL